MLSAQKSKIEPLLDVVTRPFLSFSPNVLTVIGLLFPILFFYSIIQSRFLLALLFLVGTSFDTLDGAVARRTGKVTLFGGVLDSSLDRLADSLIISSFGFAGIVQWELVLSLLVASYMISYVRSRAELAGKARFKLDVGLIERSERLMGIGIIVITILLFPVREVAGYSIIVAEFALLLGLSIVTVLQRLKATYWLLKQTS